MIFEKKICIGTVKFGLKYGLNNIKKIQIDEAKVAEEIKRLKLAEPMRLLRQERNKKLAETDWWSTKQIDGRTMTQEQKDYRNALRDLPSKSSPTLDEQGNLTNVTWPTKPE